jgi:hypothetical protein
MLQEAGSRGTTKEHEWQPPAALPRAGTYAWSVRAKAGARSSSPYRPDEAEARFGVRGADIVDAIVAAGSCGERHIVIGLMY